MSPEQDFKWSGCNSVNRRLRLEESKNMNSFAIVLLPMKMWEVDNLHIAGALIISTKHETAKMFPTYSEGLIL